jgi:asparagine synthase (glutamine-hydrolysing)
LALSGLGGDEMFAGYSSFRTVPRMERLATRGSAYPAVRNPLASIFASDRAATDQNRKLIALGRNGHESSSLFSFAHAVHARTVE